MACDGINADLLLDCDNPLVLGTGDIVYLANKADVTITYNDAYDPDSTGVNQRVATSISLASGKYLRQYEGKRDSTVGSYAVRKGTFNDVFTHQVDMKLLNNNPLVKKEIEAMVSKGDIIAIVENNFRGANEDAAFEIYGADSGLDISEASRNTSDADTQGGHSVILATSERGGESRIPVSLVVPSTGGVYAATKALLQGLLEP